MLTEEIRQTDIGTGGDNMNRDNMNRDNIGKDNIGKDNTGKDNMDKNNLSKDSIDKESNITKMNTDKNNELPYLYWLLNIDGIGRKTLMVLSAYAGSPAEIYRMPEKDLKWLLNQRQFHNLTESRRKWNLLEEYQKLQKKEIGFYPYGYPGYPEKCLFLPDPPAALYVKGKLPDAKQSAVAIIGTRKCTGYGSTITRQLGTALAAAGVQVISGMARGIDGIGQRAVTEAGGNTFAVLGCGVDICYPPENRWLYERITERGGIISEYNPGTQPKASLFPPRNRIISGLSDCIVVVEASEKSGTMITVDMALEQGREVYAIPGRVADSQSSGCNRLIKQGAGMILSIEEFLWELGIYQAATQAPSGIPNQITATPISLHPGSETASQNDIISASPNKSASGHQNDIMNNHQKPVSKHKSDIVSTHQNNTISKQQSDIASRRPNNTTSNRQNKSGGNLSPTVGNVLSEDEKRVFSCLDYEPRSLALIADLCPEIPSCRLTQLLVTLCLKGNAAQIGAGFYYRRDC